MTPDEARKRRKDAGLTLAQLAQRIGVAERTVLRWEQSKSKPHNILSRRWELALDAAERRTLDGRRP